MSRLKPYLEIGQIVGTHGIRGELRVQPWCDSPDFFCAFTTLYLDGEGARSLRVRQARPHKHMVILAAEGVDNIAAAEGLRSKTLYMDRADAPPIAGHYVQDLLGCAVFDADNGQSLGVLTDVLPTGANDVWQITRDGKNVLIPAVDEVLRRVDVESGEIVIAPLDGLFE